MILTIKDRLLMPTILPSNGNLIEMTICKSIMDSVVFSADEIQEFNLTDLPSGGVKYTIEKARNIDITFNSVQISILKKAVNQLDKDCKITLELLDLCEKINKS